MALRPDTFNPRLLRAPLIHFSSECLNLKQACSAAFHRSALSTKLPNGRFKRHVICTSWPEQPQCRAGCKPCQLSMLLQFGSGGTPLSTTAQSRAPGVPRLLMLGRVSCPAPRAGPWAQAGSGLAHPTVLLAALGGFVLAIASVLFLLAAIPALLVGADVLVLQEPLLHLLPREPPTCCHIHNHALAHAKGCLWVIQEARRTAIQAQKLLSALERELPDTAAAMRLTSLEMSDCISEFSLLRQAAVCHCV